MMKSLISLIVIALGILVRIPSSSQVQSRDTISSRMIIDVEATSQKGVFHFDINGQRVPTSDILGFLAKHWNEYSRSTVPIVMVPPSLTVLEIASIEATFSKAGYQTVRFFLYAKKSDFVQELIIKAPAPAGSIRGPIPAKM